MISISIRLRDEKRSPYGDVVDLCTGRFEFLHTLFVGLTMARTVDVLRTHVSPIHRTLAIQEETYSVC